MSRRRLQLLLAWAVFLALGGSIYLGPYFAAWSIRRAVAAGDAEALHAFVDFEAVRENLKGELRRTVEAGRRARQQAESPPPPDNEDDDAAVQPAAPAPDPLGDLGARVAVSVGETMIDRFATPEGVDRALRAGAEAGGSGWSSFLDLGGDGEGEGAGDDSDGGGISVSAGYDGWSDFAVRLGVESESAEGAPIWADILFERRGIWAWRVTGARVSPDAISLLVR